MLRILSLGAGVQSSTLFLMSCVGDLPKLDAAIFSDTGWEKPEVYKNLEWLKAQGEAAGIPLHVVNNGNIREEAIASARDKNTDIHWASMPFFVDKGPGEDPGYVTRQCSREYKGDPIDAKLREMLGLKKGYRHKTATVLVEQWFGMSADEPGRMRTSKHSWVRNHYPLVFDFDPPMNRQDCLKWCRERGFPEPPRSACIGCPFHSDHEWRIVRADPEMWADAVEFDKANRKRDGMLGDCYLHRSLKPLDEVDLDTPEEKGQMGLWDEECGGLCAV